MVAIRADFACLALNFTLCSVFTGRYFTGSEAPTLQSTKDPSGFVLLQSPRQCSFDQWSSAVNRIRPSLKALVWSPALCPQEVTILRKIPPKGRVYVNKTRVKDSAAPTCASALLRKGSKLYALHSSSAVALPGSSCSRPGALEVCQLLTDYRDASGSLNPLRREASFVLNTKGDRKGKAKGGGGTGEAQKRRAGQETKSRSSEKSESRKNDKTRSVERSEGGSQGGEQGSDAAAASRGKAGASTEMGRKTRKGSEEKERKKGKARGGEKRKVPEESDSLAGEEEEDFLDPADTKMLLEQMGNPGAKELMNAALAKLTTKDYRSAIQLYDLVEENLKEKFVGRGVAYVFLGHKERALEEFDKAAEYFPDDADVFRRRSSLLAEMGRKSEAFADLTRSIELDPDNEDARHARGALAFNDQDWYTAVEDFNVSVQKRPNDPVVLNALGLSLMGGGRYQDAADTYRQAVRNVPSSASLWSEKGRAHKELGQVEEAEEALRMALKLEEGTVLYHRLASLKHLTGHHRETLKVAEKGLKSNPKDIELNFLAAASRHAQGEFIEAIRGYEQVLSLEAGGNSGMLTQQFLAFYLREICAYTVTKAHLPIDAFHLDQDMSPKFKVHWVKKMNPMELFPGYEPVRLTQDMVNRGPARSALLSQDALKLIEAADRIGRRAQYFVHGFMPNRRQYRVAGLASLDLMQRARATWQAAREGLEQSKQAGKQETDKPGAGKQGVHRSSSKGGAPMGLGEEEEDEDEGVVEEGSGKKAKRKAGLNGFGTEGAGGKGSKGSKGSKGARLIKDWRDMFNNLVRWRQLSEPVDTIAWIDGLGKEYIAGFGSITAMTVGQMENLKYYPEYKRGFELMKQRLYDSQEAMNGTGAGMHISRQRHGDAILAATTRKALFEVVGENFFVTTQCYSYAKPGKIMNGTQLTLVESTQSYDFAIRTPVTPDRMDGFGFEMQAAWEDLTDLVLNDELKRRNPTYHQEKMRDCILRIGYFWYQLMPLARGSAMVGLVSMHGLSLATGIEITQFIPKGLQIDWESILVPQFQMFKDSVAPWFFADVAAAPLDLPIVMEALPTVRHVIAAMSHEED